VHKYITTESRVSQTAKGFYGVVIWFCCSSNYTVTVLNWRPG